MNLERLIPILGGVLVAQLLLAAVLHWGGGDFGSVQAGNALLAFDQAQVDRLVIQGEGEERVELVKTEDGWRIPNYFDFPAQAFKVGELINKLAELKPRHPVATSSAAAERFKVADDAFERRVGLYQGDDQLAELYLGDSPGFRRIFARAQGQDAVYEVELASHDVGAAGKDWADKTVLRVNQDDIAQVELGELIFERRDDAWVLADLAEGEQMIQAEADQIVDRLANPSFLEVMAADQQPEGEPVVSAKLIMKEGDPITLAFHQAEGNDDYVLARSGWGQRFWVAPWSVENLVEAKREGLVEKPAEAPDATAEPNELPED